MVRLKKKLNVISHLANLPLYSHNGQCVVDVVAGVEANNICSVAHCANVKVAKCECGVAMVEDVMLEIS